MEFKRRFGRRKKANPKRGIMLVLLLAIVILLWFNAEKILNSFF